MDYIQQVMNFYPLIYFACHTRHVKDPNTHQKISTHQGSILDHLDDVEPTGISSLASHMGVTPSTMSLNIDRLEKKGYVERSVDPQDARRVQVRLTKEGLEIREAKSVLDPDLVEGMLDQLTKEQQKEAIEGLALLSDAAMRFMKKKTENHHQT